jgi:hypothetical protein
MKAATKKATKELVLIARYTFKHNGATVYRVRSNQHNKKGRVEGVDQVEFKGEWFDAHNVTCIENEVRGCTCKGSEYRRKCFHRDGVQSRLVERQEVASQFLAAHAPSWLVELVSKGVVVAPKQVVKTVSPQLEQVASEIGISVEQLQELLPIAQEHHKEMIEGKHTEMCLPIGPRDTKKDIMRKSSLNGSQQSAGLIMALPSRKKAEVA